MNAHILLDACLAAGIDFFTGVPDSQLAGLCDTLYARFGVKGSQHIVAANEGGAVGLCAGHYLATGRPGLCYMQNSGLGNAVNPLASLMDEQVYALPCLLVVGWRGEPGVHDEPQHVTQGAITLAQLELLKIPYRVLSADTTEEAFRADFASLLEQLRAGRTVALVVRKGALTCPDKPAYGNGRTMTREDAVACIARMAGPQDALVSTTGKLSRELFEIRQQAGQGHAQDFLTVGSMGHASMITLGMALAQPHRRFWCLDGDGAALMHLGALSIIGQHQPSNLLHIVINNAAHETVGGMPVCAGRLDVAAAAQAAGYPNIFRADSIDLLERVLLMAQESQSLCLVEVMCACGARADLGRPTSTPQENRDALMAFLGRRS